MSTELNCIPAVSLSHIDSTQLQPCLSGNPQPACGAGRQIKAAIDTIVVVAVLYFVATLGILLWKLKSFRSLPYAQVQVAVVFYRLQVGPFFGSASFTAFFFVLHPRARLAVDAQNTCQMFGKKSGRQVCVSITSCLGVLD